jgi:hypothetical protein
MAGGVIRVLYLLGDLVYVVEELMALWQRVTKQLQHIILKVQISAVII